MKAKEFRPPNRCCFVDIDLRQSYLKAATHIRTALRPLGLGAFLLPLDHVMSFLLIPSNMGLAFLPGVAGERLIPLTLVLLDKWRSGRLGLQGHPYQDSYPLR